VPTLKTNMTEMKHAQVSRISLVSKAASRIPFRVLKEDRTMQNPLRTLDLAQVFKGQKQAEIVGVITMKGEGFAAVKEAVAKAGFKVDSIVENADGSVVLKQGEMKDGEQLTVIKMSDDLAVAMKGFSPYNMSLAGTDESAASFSDMCAAQGFYPGVSTMMGVLQSSVYDLTYKSDDPAAASEAVAKMFDEAKNYAISLLKALPSQAFKLEKVSKGSWETSSGAPNTNDGGVQPPGLPDGAKGVMGTSSQGTQGAGSGAAEDNATPPNAGKPGAKAGLGGGNAAVGDSGTMPMPKEGDTAGHGGGNKVVAAKGEGEGEHGGGSGGAPATTVSKSDIESLLAGALGTLGKQLTDTFTAQVGEVKKSVDAVQNGLQTLGAKVTEVEGVAKAAEKAVKGTVMGSEAGDHASLTQKSEQGGGYRGREIDTGWSPRAHRAAR
jgi:hypothetical protein